MMKTAFVGYSRKYAELKEELWRAAGERCAEAHLFFTHKEAVSMERHQITHDGTRYEFRVECKKNGALLAEVWPDGGVFFETWPH